MIMDPFIDPAMAEWLRQKKEALGGAIAADKASQVDEDRRALLMQFAQGYANKRPVAVPARQVDDAQRQFQAETGLEQGARDDSLAAFKAISAAQPKPGEDDTVPEDWGAPASVTSRKEAIRLGWGPKPPEAGKASPTDEQLARGAALGLTPAEGEGSESFEKAIRAAKMASEDARRQGGVTYVMGGDERLYGLPTRLPAGGAVPPPKPVPTPPRSEGAGFSKDKDLPAAERNRLSDIAGDVSHVESLGRDFKDEFAGMGPLGGASVWAAQRAGSVGTEGMQKLGEFWSRYERMINIPERHERFGSALTPQEKQSWDAARNIRPGVDPKVARRAFAEVAGITRAVMQRIGDALVADGYGAEAVKAATGGLYQPKGAAPAGGAAPAAEGAPVRRFTRVNGKLVEVSE